MSLSKKEMADFELANFLRLPALTSLSDSLNMRQAYIRLEYFHCKII